MRRRRSAAKATFVVLLSVMIAFCLAIFPLRGQRTAQGAPRGSADKPVAGAKAPRGGAATSQSATAPASKDAAKDGEKDGSKEAPKEEPKEAQKAQAEELKELPVEGGLPVGVRIAVYYLEVTGLDDAKGEFTATTDVRMIWKDLRQSFDPSEEIHGFKELRFAAADKKLETMWSPHVEITNLVEKPSHSQRRLRMFPGGEIELTTRTTAKYKISIDASRFPFDRQHLALDFIVRENDNGEVELESHRDDVEWSRPASNLSIDGWTAGIVDIEPSEEAGWNGDRYARVRFALDADRDPKGAVAPVFIPLVASLLIPLLAIWMNRTNEEGFEVEAFELANVVIGGLFSVIALSFAIYSAYGVIAGGDNTVTRLFALNYVSLACSLLVVVGLFRFNLVHRMFGPYVHAEVFRFVLWALPVLSTATSIAFILAARA